MFSSGLKWVVCCGLAISIVIVACKEPFDPKIQGVETGFLVVDGYINLGANAITSIRLTRTSKISESSRIISETGAVVNIEDQDGNQYPLAHQGLGVYVSPELNLSTENTFRLSILTSEGKQYYSQFEESYITPEMDSVVWRRVDAGVGIYVNTHDPDNNLHYYQWDYEEVWEIRSPYFSFYYYDGQIKSRPDPEILEMFKCWKYEYPSQLLITSTANLTVDAVSMREIIMIPVSGEKISYQYSVLVKQHALSRQAFEYFQMMDKNTSEVGSYFDPLPSELNGNMYCQSSNEPVVGYMGAYTTTSERIFIREREVKDWNHSLGCDPQIFVGNAPDSLQKYFSPTGGYVPTSSNGAGAYYGATPPCVDCRMRGGGHVRPPFW
jgi:hypothetical protein